MRFNVGAPFSHLLLECCMLLFAAGSTMMMQQQQRRPNDMMAAAVVVANGDNSEVNNYPSMDNRNDGEYRTCVLRYQVNMETIIRTQDSKALGARYINETELPSQEDCLLWCCQTDFCNAAIFERKERGSCYLFDCGPPNDFKCKFAPHHQYSSAILDTSNLESEKQQQHSHPKTNKQTSKAAAVVDEHIVALKNLKHQQQTENKAAATAPHAPPLELTTAAFATLLTPSPSSLPPAPSAGRRPSANNGAGEEGEGGRCSHFQFQCRSTNECIAVYNACDGIPQCADGSDEGVELGCPTEGRRYGGEVLPSVVHKPTENVNSKSQAINNNNNNNNNNMGSEVENEEIDQRPVSSHRKQLDSATATAFGRNSQAVAAAAAANDEQKYFYPSNNIVKQQQQQMENAWSDSGQGQSNDYQPPKPIPPQQHLIRNKVGAVNDGRSNGQQPPAAADSNQRPRYNDNNSARFYQHQEAEEEQKSRHNKYLTDENMEIVKNQPMYNDEVKASGGQLQLQYGDGELSRPSNYQMNRHYEAAPPAPDMNEYYEGNAYRSSYRNRMQNDNSGVLGGEKGSSKDSTNQGGGNWRANSNRFPQQQQQQQMYDDRGGINPDVNNYQSYAEADIGPVHVHVDAHQNDMMSPPRTAQGHNRQNSGHYDTKDVAVKEADGWETPASSPDKNILQPISSFHHGVGQQQQLGPAAVQQKTPMRVSPSAVNSAPLTVIAATVTTTTTTTTTSPPVKVETNAATQRSGQKSAAVKSPVHNRHQLELEEVEAVHVQMSSESSGAIVALTLGLSISGLLLVLVGCRLRMIRRKLRKNRGPYAHDADYLVNGMYL